MNIKFCSWILSDNDAAMAPGRQYRLLGQIQKAGTHTVMLLLMLRGGGRAAARARCGMRISPDVSSFRSPIVESP